MFSDTTQVYSIPGGIVLTKIIDGKEVNESCTIDSCLALKIKEINGKKLDLRGGKNPGAAACKQLLGGKTLNLKTNRHEVRTFCLFEDGSFISNRDLFSLIINN